MNFTSYKNVTESFFKLKTFKSFKEVMEPFFGIKNFKKVMMIFFCVKDERFLIVFLIFRVTRE